MVHERQAQWFGIPEVRNLADVGHEELCVHSSPLSCCLIIVSQLLVLGRAPPMETAGEYGLVVEWALEVWSLGRG